MTYELYVDGSFMKRSTYAGWGWVLVGDGEYITSAYGLTLRPALARNIDGELQATMDGLSYLLECTEIRKLKIVHDYLGIAKWVTGEWNACKEVSISYLRFMKRVTAEGFSLEFKHVRGHSGDKWNDEADRLAKLAITERFPQ